MILTEFTTVPIKSWQEINNFAGQKRVSVLDFNKYLIEKYIPSNIFVRAFQHVPVQGMMRQWTEYLAGILKSFTTLAETNLIFIFI